MNCDRATRSALGLSRSACTGWRSNNIHSRAYSCRLDLHRRTAIHNVDSFYPQDNCYVILLAGLDTLGSLECQECS